MYIRHTKLWLCAGQAAKARDKCVREKAVIGQQQHAIGAKGPTLPGIDKDKTERARAQSADRVTPPVS